MSAILFGPPGTSKTTIASRIASYLGWPLLTVDPSHLVRKGMDFIQAEANQIFDMLAATESVVVLFDEFDEMVRDRSSSSSEVVSRFLTTAMLPKLSKIHERRRIVFILATNQIDQFDLAISRLGRFDRMFQIMPPTVDAKLSHDPWKDAAKQFTKFDIKLDEKLRDKLESLTYYEFDSLVPKIRDAESSQKVIEAIDQAASACTLERKIDTQDHEPQTWRDKCEAQRKFIRID
jgi:SpoVK/Ycf46/Vps4 family AAA+-type ATPase